MRIFLTICIFLIGSSSVFCQASVFGIDSLIVKLEKKGYKHHIETRATTNPSVSISENYFIDSLSNSLYKVVHKEEGNGNLYKAYYFQNIGLIKVEYITGDIYACIIALTDFYFTDKKIIHIEGLRRKGVTKDVLLKEANGYLNHFEKLISKKD